MNELSLINSIFNDVLGNPQSTVYTAVSSPKVDVKEEENSYVLEMELPGRSENDVSIELDHDNLTISSKLEEQNDEKKSKYILRERHLRSFERRFTLPADVNSEEINASFKNGILTINMGKKEIAAPKKIAITAC